ncbi:Shr3 amino acid permease chaperone [Cryphonectria parasitica EP155]|uniref:Shr3 amino acid permease chaperone n=1 Tax=Cryphonectria parasitica (strain ATCC 38755 / EP155) TaxID=660469 RepID=A0A9P4Y1D7_CRYP1|nr:Shr3 amino acid permease chaperone [Cryphonectria parasitica EP155]KAF3764791.1 Shr3 amino acid permease chaperone [Cryphonectria parasitica EP155]
MSGVFAIDRSKTVRSKDYRGSSSFATFLIVGPVCFFLGIIFAQFPYDYPLLWTSAPVAPTFFDQLETHLKFMHQSPPLIARLLHIMVAVGFLGFFIKLFRPSESNMLFDGASLVMYLIGVGVYVANIVKGLRAVSSDIWAEGRFEELHEGPLTGEIVLGREDSLKVMAASNTILALVLVGVLVLQGGQWYADRKELDDYELIEQQEEQAKSSTKKKQ